MQIIEKRKYFFVISGILVLASLLIFFTWGLKLGIDFTGGVLLELDLKQNNVTATDFKEKMSELKLEGLTVQKAANQNNLVVRYISNDDDLNQKVLEKIKEVYPESVLERQEFISSVISGELKSKAFTAIGLAVIGIALYIAWAFRKVSYPVESWKYGISAVIALVHDIIITVGIFVYLGRFYGLEINLPFIAALLTILGYSVNDTIVVFDRIRENLLRAGSKDDFEATVNRSINETIARSINTSLTVIFVLVAMLLFGGEAIFAFSLALLCGVFFGTYSSIFVASALLVDLWKWKRR